MFRVYISHLLPHLNPPLTQFPSSNQIYWLSCRFVCFVHSRCIRYSSTLFIDKCCCNMACARALCRCYWLSNISIKLRRRSFRCIQWRCSLNLCCNTLDHLMLFTEHVSRLQRTAHLISYRWRWRVKRVCE